MRPLLHVVLILLFSNHLASQSSQDSLQALHYLEQMISVMEDESKEDSIIIYENLAKSIYIKNKAFESYLDLQKPFVREVINYGYLEAADTILKKALETAQQELASPQIPMALLTFERARGYWLWQEFPQALMHSEKGLKFPLKDHPIIIGDFLNIRGLCLGALGQPGLAEKSLKEALRIYQNATGASSFKAAIIHNNLGIHFMDMGYLDLALDHLYTAYEIRKQVDGPKHRITLEVLNNLNVVAIEKGEYKRAIDGLLSALTILEVDLDKNAALLSIIHTNLGMAYRALGNLSIAEDHLNQSLILNERFKKPNAIRQLQAYRVLANVLADQGQYEQAIKQRKQILSTLQSQKHPDPKEIAWTSLNIGLDFKDVHQLDSSLVFLQKAADYFENHQKNELELANVSIDISEIYLLKGQREQARNFAEKAIQLHQGQALNHNPQLAYALNSMARIELAEGNFQQALDLAQQAIETNRFNFQDLEKSDKTLQTGQMRNDYFFESLLLKGKALEALGRRSEARTQYRIAEKVLENGRIELVSKDDKILQAKNVFELAVTSIENELQSPGTDRQKWEAAFYHSEKNKASVLFSSINANQAKYFSGIPESLILLEEELQSDINFYKLKLVQRIPDTLRVDYQNKLFAARRRYTNLLSDLKQNYPTYFELLHDVRTPRVGAIQLALDPQTAILSYFSTEERIYAFYIDKNDFHFTSIHKDLALKQDLEAFYEAITRKLKGVYLFSAQRLYQKLMPFTIPQSIEHLVFIPDAELLSLPFEALLTRDLSISEEKADEILDFSALPYLINQYQVSYALSGMLYYQSLTQPLDLQNNDDNMLALAPIFGDNTLIPSTVRSTINRLGQDQDAFTYQGSYVAPLPATEREVSTIQQVFQKHDIQVNSFTNQEASESLIKGAQARQAKYLHIATHGFVNEALPELSGLLLHRSPGSKEDGILVAGEVYNLRLNADLVALSACQTGIGKITTGEGILGLSRAFKYAGAKNLMVSLWKVADDSTADLMTHFYEKHLDKKESHFAGSLKLAKQKMIESKTYSHPYYWSAFILIGE